jgi:hypothetical protein
MPNSCLIDVPSPPCCSVDTLERDILAHIDEEAVISLDALAVFMPQYGWNRIFLAVDQLARCGRIVLRRHRFEYVLFSADYAA